MLVWLPFEAVAYAIRSRRRLRHGGFVDYAGRRLALADELPSKNSVLAALGSWFLLLVVAGGAYIGRGDLVNGADYWVLLTIVNLVTIAAAIVLLRHRPLHRVLVMWGIILVYVLGGVLQAFLFNYNIAANSTFLATQDPEMAFATQGDVGNAYGLITLSFSLTVGAGLFWAATTRRPHFPIVQRTASFRRLTTWLIWLSIAYGLLTIFQKLEGFGVLDISPKPLPLHIVALTLFYRQFVYPGALLVGIWVFDRGSKRKMWWCVMAIGVVTASDTYLSTSRGDVIYFGLPLLFLWVLTGRFTRLRKSLVIVGLLAYLVATPVLTDLRASRAHAATNTNVATGVATVAPSPFSTAGLDKSIGHTLIRVGGTGSVIQTAGHQAPLSITGIYDAYRPSGLVSYFTYTVVGVPRSSTINEGRTPTAVGLGALVGGTFGVALLSLLTISLMALGWRYILRHFMTWPVALALFAESALRFYSEGVPIQFYKTLLAIAAIEVGYRWFVQARPVMRGRRPSLPDELLQDAAVGAKPEVPVAHHGVTENLV